MTSSVTQELVLSPLWFVLYTNNLDANVQAMVSKFAGATKIDCIIDSVDGYQEL